MVDAVWLGAAGVKAERVVGDGKAFGFGNRVLALFDFGVVKLFDLAAVQYNMGAATLIGGYASNDTGTKKESGYNIGVKVPVGADYIAAAYSSYDAGTGAKTGFGVNYIKAMGKTTIGYLGYSSVDSVNKTGAGVRYNF